MFKRSIFWILVFALGLRLWGISYGFPLFLVNDEPALVLGALKMIELKTLLPALHQEEFKKVLYYPPLPSYFYLVTLAPVIAAHWALSGFPPVEQYKDIVTLDPSFIWIAARVLNALMSVVLIAFIYLIARRITRSERAGLLAAIFLSLSFYHLQLSQVVRHWMPAALLIYASWYAALRIRDLNLKKSYVLSGVLAGLAGGVNTSSAVAVIPAIFFHFSRKGEKFLSKISSSRFWLMLGAALLIALVFVALYPYGLTRGEGAAGAGSDLGARIFRLSSVNFADWLKFLYEYLKLLWRYEAILFAAAAGGMILFWRNKKDAIHPLLALAFGLAHLSLLYFFFNKIPRALVFILPILSVFAGYFADRAILKAQNFFRATAANLFLVYLCSFIIFFAWPLVIDLRYVYLFSQKDTRLLAKDWIRANIPAGTKMMSDTPYLRLTNTKEGIQNLENLDPSGLRSQDRALLRRDDEHYPALAFYVLNLHFISPTKPERITSNPEYFRKLGFKYVVVEYEHTDRSDLFPPTRRLVEDLRLIKRFQPFSGNSFVRALDISGEIATIHPLELFKLERFGQVVDVYKL